MILSAILAAAAAALTPQVALTIDPSHRIVEGVATDGSTIFVSSLVDRQILACRGGSCRPFAAVAPPLHPFGIAWDDRRNLLWVAADCPPGVSFIQPCARGALLAFDRDGQLRFRTIAPVAPFHPGDVSTSWDEVFVSDSQSGAVFRLMQNGRTLQPIVNPGTGKSAQGSARAQVVRDLIVADYSQGITHIDLWTAERRLLKRQDGSALRGIDGLVRCGDRFIGVYNGDTPGRLVSFRRTKSGIDVEELVPGLALPDPTQLAIQGRNLLVVADSGWDNATKNQQRTVGATIVAIPLGKSCGP